MQHETKLNRSEMSANYIKRKDGRQSSESVGTGYWDKSAWRLRPTDGFNIINIMIKTI